LYVYQRVSNHQFSPIFHGFRRFSPALSGQLANQGSDVFSGSLAWMLPAEWWSPRGWVKTGGRWWKKPGEKGGKMVVSPCFNHGSMGKP